MKQMLLKKMDAYMVMKLYIKNVLGLIETN